MATANKTGETDASVEAYLAAIGDAERRDDCRRLAALMTRVTGEPPRLWGPAIVGFGRYHYRYESGREGEACATGFASRKGAISIYLTASFDGQAALLARLGRHRMGKACLAVKRLADVDARVLEQLVAGSVAAIRQRHP
jgi:hypothetical protein